MIYATILSSLLVNMSSPYLYMNPINHRSKNILQIIVLSMISTLLMLGDDFLHQIIIVNNQAELEFEYIMVLLTLNIALWGSGSFIFTSLILIFL